mgnify:CR=1 FL=1
MWLARRRTSCLLFVGVVGVCYVLFIFTFNPAIRRDQTRPQILHTSFSFLSQQSAILVTGCLGTVGTPLSLLLLQQGVTVICVDLLTSALQNRTQFAELELEYLTPQESQSIHLLESFPNFVYRQGDIRHPSSVENIFFGQNQPPIEGVIHLALIKAVRPLCFEQLLFGV